MKKYILILGFICTAWTMQAQNPTWDYENAIQPIDRPNRLFEEYLVQLAWENNPMYKIHPHDVFIQEQEIKLARRAWADDILFSFNINELNAFGDQGDPPVGTPVQSFNAFPRWNFSASVRLGTFLNHPLQVKIEREKLKVLDLEMYQEKINMRTEVLEAYTDYLQAIEVVKLRTTAEEDALTTYQLLANLFKSDESHFDEFNNAANSYHRAKEATLDSNNAVALAKLKIEHYIGIKFSKAELLHESVKKY